MVPYVLSKQVATTSVSGSPPGLAPLEDKISASAGPNREETGGTYVTDKHVLSDMSIDTTESTHGGIRDGSTPLVVMTTGKSLPAQVMMQYAHAYAWRIDDSLETSVDELISVVTSPIANRYSDAIACRPQHNLSLAPSLGQHTNLSVLPTELLLRILEFLDVDDVLAMSRTSHLFRTLSLAPILHHYRLQRSRILLPPLLFNPSRPSIRDLKARSIILTRNTAISRKLARALASIRLSRRLAVRPSPQSLVERCVLPANCVPGHEKVAPALVAKQRAVERERLKDGLRRWVGSVLEQRVREKSEGVKRSDERSGVGRVWRLRRHWERVAKGEVLAIWREAIV